MFFVLFFFSGPGGSNGCNAGKDRVLLVGLFEGRPDMGRLSRRTRPGMGGLPVGGLFVRGLPMRRLPVRRLPMRRAVERSAK